MSASLNDLQAAGSRREFLKVSVAAGGGLLLGFALPRAHTAEHAGAGVAPFAPDAFIRIDRSGTVTLIMCQVEMGQGIYTAISQILADEMDADFKRVVVEAAPPNDALYSNAALGFQVTGGSTSIRVFWTPMRKAGASARAMLVEAAAASWGVAPGSCRTANSEVIHESSGRRLAYGALVDRAARLTPPKDPQGLSADRHARAPAGFTGQGQWSRDVWHRRHASGRQIRDLEVEPGVRRQGRARR